MEQGPRSGEYSGHASYIPRTFHVHSLYISCKLSRKRTGTHTRIRYGTGPVTGPPIRHPSHPPLRYRGFRKCQTAYRYHTPSPTRSRPWSNQSLQTQSQTRESPLSPTHTTHLRRLLFACSAPSSTLLRRVRTVLPCQKAGFLGGKGVNALRATSFGLGG